MAQKKQISQIETQIEVYIAGVETRCDAERNEYTVYLVQVHCGESFDKLVEKRFREFAALNEELIANFPGESIPPFPSKAVFGGKRLGREVINDRQVALNNYLRALNAVPRIIKCYHMLMFLEIMDVFETMKAAFILRFGGNEEIKLDRIVKPQITNSAEVLVRIYAASINAIDVKLREGSLKLILPYKFPLVLGHDLSGVVEAVGSNVTKFKPGDKVYGRVRNGQIGTFAEFIVAHEADLATKPQNLTHIEAASIPLVGLTAYQALIEEAKVQKGQRVLVTGGSGGIGTFAIQLAKHFLEARVVTTATEPEKRELCELLGADVVIDYREGTELTSVLRADFDVVFETTGEITRTFSVLKPGGKCISIAGTPDASVIQASGGDFAQNKRPWYAPLVMDMLNVKLKLQADLNQIKYSPYMNNANGSQLTSITPLLEKGVIRPVANRVFPFEQIKEAFSFLESGKSSGKIVVSIIPEKD